MYNRTMTSKITALVLATVNAPYGETLDEAALVHCLKDPAAAKAMPGHMSSFFADVTPEAQKEFAEAHGIPLASLIDAAREFACYSGQKYPLLG
jgi:hypothetical protein